MSYVKHIYWLTKEEVSHLEERLADRGMKVKSAKGVVCTPLDEINKISCVAPEVWDETCARQGSGAVSLYQMPGKLRRHRKMH